MSNFSFIFNAIVSYLDNLKKLNNNTLNINGTGVGETNITNANDYINSSSNVINNTIIPNIEEKINS